ncbi:hypothetical protein RCL1_003479 [Eukaryota sp. TZLM3-RCL]
MTSTIFLGNLFSSEHSNPHSHYLGDILVHPATIETSVISELPSSFPQNQSLQFSPSLQIIFKSSSSIDSSTFLYSINRFLTISTCALLNTSGGLAFLGITDTGTVEGLSLPRNTRDVLRCSLSAIVSSLTPRILSHHASFKLVPVSKHGFPVADLFVVVLGVFYHRSAIGVGQISQSKVVDSVDGRLIIENSNISDQNSNISDQNFYFLSPLGRCFIRIYSADSSSFKISSFRLPSLTQMTRKLNSSQLKELQLVSSGIIGGFKQSKIKPLESNLTPLDSMMSSTLTYDSIKRAYLFEMFSRYRVVFVSGHGKSTVLPQMIVDHVSRVFRSNRVIVAQKHALWAVQSALYLSKLRGWTIGEDIGILTPNFQKYCDNCRILYCSYETLVSIICSDTFSSYSHVILDDYHYFSPLLCVSLTLLKLQMTRNYHFSIILTSNIDPKNLGNYFGVPYGHFILNHSRHLIDPNFSVKINHLEDLPSQFRSILPVYFFKKESPTFKLDSAIIVIELFLQSIVASRNHDSVIIYLPSRSCFHAIIASLQSSETVKNDIHVITLDDYVDASQFRQSLGLIPHEKSKVKVILTCDFGQGFFLTDVTCVIDFCMSRAIKFDPDSKSEQSYRVYATRPILESRSNHVCQSKSCAVYRLIPSSIATDLSEISIEKLNSLDLDRLSLFILSRLNMTPFDFFKLLPINLPTELISFSHSNLIGIGACKILDPKIHNNSEILPPNITDFSNFFLTPFGRFLSLLNVSPELGTFLLLSFLFNFLEEAIIISAFWDAKFPLFQEPILVFQQMRRLANDLRSDHVAHLHMFKYWESNYHLFNSLDDEFAWISENSFIPWSSLRVADKKIFKLKQSLFELGLGPAPSESQRQRVLMLFDSPELLFDTEFMYPSPMSVFNIPLGARQGFVSSFGNKKVEEEGVDNLFINDSSTYVREKNQREVEDENMVSRGESGEEKGEFERENVCGGKKDRFLPPTLLPKHSCHFIMALLGLSCASNLFVLRPFDSSSALFNLPEMESVPVSETVVLYQCESDSRLEEILVGHGVCQHAAILNLEKVKSFAVTMTSSQEFAERDAIVLDPPCGYSDHVQKLAKLSCFRTSEAPKITTFPFLPCFQIHLPPVNCVPTVPRSIMRSYAELFIHSASLVCPMAIKPSNCSRNVSHEGYCGVTSKMYFSSKNTNDVDIRVNSLLNSLFPHGWNLPQVVLLILGADKVEVTPVNQQNDKNLKQIKVEISTLSHSRLVLDPYNSLKRILKLRRKFKSAQQLLLESLFILNPHERPKGLIFTESIREKFEKQYKHVLIEMLCNNGLEHYVAEQVKKPLFDTDKMKTLNALKHSVMNR